ncbi:SDR family oxidoreductase [Corallococcus macrosporus]|uniref:SDR family oxidoreductase n=1 Tax=Corallococcus macrosporus TaxID=35 RepID=A0ABS3DGC0_9BACT|nr:SDR family oxidoreductase [Corallococcus macrosporus]MBN8230360.1 SDR family oxidoreductase [Corallococcus macrosporus]
MTTPNSQQQQKTALVTGASRGIGAAVAERLARDGFNVLVNYAGNHDAAQAVVRRIEAAGGRALGFQADVADVTAFPRMFDAAEATFGGGVDVLVNNAGIGKFIRFADFDDALFDQHVAVNIKGTFNGLREAARRLRDGGRVINFSTSVIGLRMENYGVYSATKAAVETMTAVLSKELRGRSITVNCVAPGPTATELFFHGKSEELVERMAKLNPLERLGTPEDIAASVAFLAGPEGGWINGQVLRANGGMV